MKKLLLILCLFLFYTAYAQQYTLIPDANFEAKLISLGIDTDGANGKVLTTSISNITKLDVSKSSIANLTGIQDFVALETLFCGENQLTSLDVSKNTALTFLNCWDNGLTSLVRKDAPS